ncbi:MAG: hypothetical protein IJN95_01055 [Clostridia bacterium]|nr:hypothetical protein [Clostridia bacterium]
MSAVKSVIKALLILALILSLTLLSACSGLSITADDFLSPPRANGELYEVEKTLKSTVKTAYTLKYPTAGEYRSAYILTDLKGSGTNEFAMAFFSTVNEENSTFMNLKLMQKVRSNWISVSDILVNAVGVERVEIADLNGDGIKEITVGWNVYGGMDKKVTVYTLNGLKLTPIMQESYTHFMCADLVSDVRRELFLIHHDTINATASAKYFTFDGEAANLAGSCMLDGGVASFNEPQLSLISNGSSAVFIDALKGAGMQTEIVYIDKKELKSLFYSSASAENQISPTYRNSTVATVDINGDGYLDIPIIKSTVIDGISIDESKVSSITNWYTYNGKELVITLKAVMNYTDGYYFQLPSRWEGVTTVNMDIENRIRTVTLWNSEDATIISELVRVRAVSEANWDKPDNGFVEYEEIARNKGVVYAAMFSSYDGEESITKEEFEKLFHIIE